MKPFLIDLLSGNASKWQGRNLLREYMQARILSCMQRSGAMVPLAFHGGTALRFLYSIPRHSEDLDFALERERDRYNLRAYLKEIQAEFTAEGYMLDLKVNDRRTVHNAFVRFPGLLYELGLTRQVNEIFSVKIEVDTLPPAGAGLATTIVRRYVTLNLQHHDRASLLAGKLHAILQRPYPKGRDLYDLLWYLSDPDWPAPNLVLLNQALEQTGWQGIRPNAGNWRSMILRRLGGIDWDRAVNDVRPFMEKESDLALLNHANLARLLEES